MGQIVKYIYNLDVFPESMIKMMLPIGFNLIIKFCFNAAKKYPNECKNTRIDIELKLSNVFENGN